MPDPITLYDSITGKQGAMLALSLVLTLCEGSIQRCLRMGRLSAVDELEFIQSEVRVMYKELLK